MDTLPPQDRPNLTFSGAPASPGVACGPLAKWATERLEVPRHTVTDPQAEIERLQASLEATRAELLIVKEQATRQAGAEEAAIFEAHLLFLQDGALLGRVRKAIAGGLNAAAAWMEGIEFFAAQLEALPDPLLKARSMDVRDAGRRALGDLLGKRPGGVTLTQPSVIAAEDLAPSQTVSLDTSLALGFCTVQGGPTSHTAILARALGIPAVTGVSRAVLDQPEGALALLDGNRGQVILNPDEETLAAFKRGAEDWQERQRTARSKAHEPAVTLDGFHVEVLANVGGAEGVTEALAYGAEGVGLFRTEFVFLDRQQLPSEEEQVQVYSKVFAGLEGRPLVVRTLDIGGDKAVAYLGVQAEPNPYLGWRGIRMMAERPEMLKTQLRAILRAGLGADLRIMLPMVSGAAEVAKARQLFTQAVEDLTRQGCPFNAGARFGIMMETPAAALIAGHLARMVDFFSIGTNDLTQYTLAVDRNNPRVAPLASPFHPAVLQLIAAAIQAAHAQGKWAGLCGELAGDPRAVPILLGLHLDEFSMSPRQAPAIKQEIRKRSRAACEAIAWHALSLASAEQVLEYLQSELSHHND